MVSFRGLSFIQSLKLFSTDINGVDNRISALEQSLKDLKQKVDLLKDKSITPTKETAKETK
jgi:hypothetical protein